MTRIVFWLLLAIVLLSPIPFGAIFPWSYTLLALIVGALVLAWLASLLVSGARPPVTPGMIALAARPVRRRAASELCAKSQQDLVYFVIRPGNIGITLGKIVVEDDREIAVQHISGAQTDF